jgi:hypothetical protein
MYHNILVHKDNERCARLQQIATLEQELAGCEPTADRSVGKGIYPTVHRYPEWLWEPTAAACLGVG